VVAALGPGPQRLGDAVDALAAVVHREAAIAEASNRVVNGRPRRGRIGSGSLACQ
jgi:hypothetical protein